MSSLAHSGWLGQALDRLPASWVRALDAWSYGIARKRLEQRRLASLPRGPVKPIAYQIKPWRD